MKTIRDVAIEGHTVLMRVDFNVPLDGDQQILDDSRIRAALGSIRDIIERKGRLILMSHLGRPRGSRDQHLSLRPVAERLAELLGGPVALAADTVGPDVERQAAALQPGEVLVLENLRFHEGEEANDPSFSERLAGLADVYVNDALGACRRTTASAVGVAEAMQAKGKPAVAGLLLEREIAYLRDAVQSPARPFVAVVGGARLSDNVPLINNLLPRCDKLLVGGAMAHTLSIADQGMVGHSRVEPDEIEAAKGLLAAGRGKLQLPIDVWAGEALTQDRQHAVFPLRQVPESCTCLDIGPATAALYTGTIRDAKTVVWNGPMGAFEIPPFARGTEAIARAIADSGATSILGDRGTATAISQLGLSDRITHISLGGRAAFDCLAGRTLPAIEALDQGGRPFDGASGAMARAGSARETDPDGAFGPSSARGPMPRGECATPERDLVDCAVYSPSRVAAGESFLVQVFAHLPEKPEEAERQALQSDEDASRRARKGLDVRIQRDSRLTFHLKAESLVIRDPVQSLIWRGRTESVQFEALAPGDCPLGNVIATVIASVDSMPVGHVKFKIKVIAEPAGALPRRQAEAERVGDDARHYRLVFISYASADRKEVLKRVQPLEALGIGYFQDFLSLSPGDRWERKLYLKLDECDVFLLFWSSAAKQSQWVMREVRRALERKGGDDMNPPEIIPVIIGGPPPVEPPEDLAHLQFDDSIIYLIHALDQK